MTCTSRKLWALLVAFVLPHTLLAQEIRGVVLQPDGATPASGVVVLLLHPTRDDSIIARTVTGDRGVYSIKSTQHVVGRLRVLRVGYQPMALGTYELFAGQTRDVGIVLSNARIRLASINIKDVKRCEVRPDSGWLVAQLFEEARKALLSSSSEVTGAESEARYTRFRRVEDTHGRLTMPIERTMIVGATLQPFSSVPVDSLARFGFVMTGKEGETYFAPDAEVLLSNAFVQTHCLQVVNGAGKRARSIGIGFRPVNRKRGAIDVQGTLWLDRETLALNTLEYSYDPMPSDYQELGVGGTVEYAQMADGYWFINHWEIRVPVVGANPVALLGAALGRAGSGKPALVGLKIGGGEVESIRVGGAVQYVNTSAATAGETERDNIDSGARLPMGVLNGVNRADDSVRTVQIDTLQHTSNCASKPSLPYSGRIDGQVTSVSASSRAQVRVTAQWVESFHALAGQNSFAWQSLGLETRANESGVYAMCGLPLRRSLSIAATRDSEQSRAATVFLSPKKPQADVDLVLKPARNKEE